MRLFILYFTLILFFSIIFFSDMKSQDILDRTKRPVGKPAPKIQLPKIQKEKLSNKLEVWLVEYHELPIIAMNLVIRSGSDHDPINLPGLASMTADVLDEGTTSRDALQISDDLESIGASMNIGTSIDGSFISINSLVKYFDKALKIYADVIVNPTFPENEFTRLKNQRLASLLQQRDNAPIIANNVFNYLLYGENHPYGNNPFGTEESIRMLSRDALIGFYNDYYRPNNAVLVVVGDITMKSLIPQLETAFKDWKPRSIPLINVHDVNTNLKRCIYLVDKQSAPQSEIRIGCPALNRNNPDFFPVMIMNRILGGQFTSRLNLNLREKHGYTYGARSSFNFLKGKGPFVASAGVATDNTDDAIREFLYEIDLMGEEGITAEELSSVKNSLIGNFVLNFETPSQIASALQNIILYDLPDNYYDTYIQSIENVSLGEVKKVAKKYLDTKKMIIVVVGDVSKIKPEIEALKIADIFQCDVTGKLLQE